MDHLDSLNLALAGKRVLDLGCGVGHLGARLAQMGCDVVCVDSRPENIDALRSRYPQLEGRVADADNDDLTPFGRFDVVFSYGLLYHLENPLRAIRNMASICDQMLLLETIVTDHVSAIVRIEDESKDFNQAMTGLGCRPTPHYVTLALHRAGFDNVYAPKKVPAYPDFQFEWKNNLESNRDGHNLRCTFVAARSPLQNDTLAPLLQS
jgi:SAM-dependent methyltransferase